MEKPIFLLILFIAIFLVLILFGFLEKKRNDRNLARFLITVNVNGIRGKSTATRLITSMLWEAG